MAGPHPSEQELFRLKRMVGWELPFTFRGGLFKDLKNARQFPTCVSKFATGSASQFTKVSKKEDTKAHGRDWQIVKHLLPNIWPPGDRPTKIRVITALLLLTGGKVFYFQLWTSLS